VLKQLNQSSTVKTTSRDLFSGTKGTGIDKIPKGSPPTRMIYLSVPLPLSSDLDPNALHFVDFGTTFVSLEQVKLEPLNLVLRLKMINNSQGDAALFLCK